MNRETTVLRNYRARTDDAVLAAVSTHATREPYTAERISYELNAPGLDRLRDITVCEYQARVGGDAVVSVDDVADTRQGRLTCRLTQDAPKFAARDTLLWAARRMQDEIDTANSPVTLIEMVKEEDLERREFLETAGFAVIRYYRVMRLEDTAAIAEIPLPSGYTFLHGPGRDGASEYVAMFNETWVDHYGFIPLTEEHYLHDLDDDPDYNADLDIVIRRADGPYVGFSFCRLDPADVSLGEVMVIGVRRGSRGLGLGRSLLVHSVKTLALHGASKIELSVDSENPTGAERLYESVGFRIKSMKRRYRLSQDEIIRLATFNAC